MLFEKGSALVPCVNEALAALTADGTLDQLQQQWLSDVVDVPVCSDRAPGRPARASSSAASYAGGSGSAQHPDRRGRHRRGLRPCSSLGDR